MEHTSSGRRCPRPASELTEAELRRREKQREYRRDYLERNRGKRPDSLRESYRAARIKLGLVKTENKTPEHLLERSRRWAANNRARVRETAQLYYRMHWEAYRNRPERWRRVIEQANAMPM